MVRRRWQPGLRGRRALNGKHNVNLARLAPPSPCHTCTQVDWLISFGADFDTRDEGTGMGPLHHAVRKHCLNGKREFRKMVTKMIEADCHIDMRDKNGCTPLMLAALYGDMKVWRCKV